MAKVAKVGAGQMTHLVKCLLYKHKDWRLDPKHPNHKLVWLVEFVVGAIGSQR